MSDLWWLRRGRVCRLWSIAIILLAGFPQAAAGESEEACLTASINAARQEQGSRKLWTDARLVVIARRHSARMAEDQRYYHNSNLRNELPEGWRTEGENVGWATDCGYMHNFFMNSPAHRKNILGASFNQIGVGVVKDSAGKLWVTEVFTESSGSSGLSSKPDQALTAPPLVDPPAPTHGAAESAKPVQTKGTADKSTPLPITSPAATAQPVRTSQPPPKQSGTAPSKGAMDPADDAGTGRTFGWAGDSLELEPIQFDLESGG